jgi:hypothetical protein
MKPTRSTGPAAILQTGRPLHDFVVRTQDGPGELQQLPSLVGQLHLARGPVEERDVQLGLELGDLLAQRRRGDHQPLGRAAEV